MMDIILFWKLIEDAKQRSAGDLDQQVALSTDALTSLETSDIATFDVLFHDCMTLAYTRELWAAAYIINGGCSDDGFDYFQGWLIAQGKSIFQDACSDPETLLDNVDSQGVELESILYVAQEAYERKTGQALPLHRQSIRELNTPLWDEETKYAMYPRLAERFG